MEGQRLCGVDRSGRESARASAGEHCNSAVPRVDVDPLPGAMHFRAAPS